ncbi:nitrate- and nitrite sensing domain-containing protein [Nocardia sp. CA2R105]|uniref:sensor histidine kinase n=1 Tax=Nocardia coffeae TaxID=2873381 RepID=UPI001CA771D4|nr:nitrate- and nitrite sensing domain-containing protein [Nocardia coffeae]MBY8862980.1 nitrate- and nitrite sensing domain-containing protein [Nocardia coffeae]
MRVFKALRTLRARVLAIALVPSIVLLIIGGGGSVYLVVQGQQLRSWGDQQASAAAPGLAFGIAVQQERRLTLMRLAGHPEMGVGLQDVRPKVDESLQQLTIAARNLNNMHPGSTSRSQDVMTALANELPTVRAKVETNTISMMDAYAFFNRLTDIVRVSMVSFAHSAPNSEVALALGTVTDLFTAADAMARGHDLAVAAEAAAGALSPAEFDEFALQIGFYRDQLQNLAMSMTPQVRAQWQALSASPEFMVLGNIESVLTRRGVSAAPSGTDSSSTTTSKPQGRADTPRASSSSGVGSPDTAALPVSTADWNTAITKVSDGMLRMWSGQGAYVSALSHQMGVRNSRNSLLAGIGVLILTLAAFATTLQLSRRMIRRLHRLRAETTQLTDEQLPGIIAALDRGEPVDIDKEMSTLDFGSDEIGQVADAFNRAQLAAVNAAATEARTREGVNSVFVNIAHRSQVVLHRHLKLLDEAEFVQEDPKVLDLLFRLHHLATRERRNAENLIILGGQQPRRQWRKPVQLDELVRGAVAETEDYARVRVVRLPDVKVSGGAVADLLHLLAELIDNATSFSPPESRVDISGNAAGRGIVVEIVDQGLGMPAAQIAAFNETLANPPDFAFAALSRENRLGMFVVARLASRIDVSVRLAESEYGGVKAIVLIPLSLMSENEADESSPAAVAGAPVPAGVSATIRSEPVGTSPNAEPAEVEVREPRRRIAQRAAGHARPALPRRRRQTSLAPELANPSPAPDEPAQPQVERSAEQARNLFSAIETGTRQGRETLSGPDRFTTMNVEWEQQ